MAVTTILEGDRLPRWLSWYLFINFDQKSKRQKRSQLVLNVISLWGTLSSLSFAVYYYLHDPSLWPGSFGCVFMALSLFLFPFVSRLGKTVLSIFVTVTICGSFVFLTYLLGAKSGVYLYIFIVPPVLAIISGTRRPWSTTLSAGASVASILFCVLFLSEAALPAANIPPFQSVLMVMAVLIPVAMVTAMVYLALFRADRAEDALEAEHARSEALLYNLLPEEIAARLKVEPDRTIADSLPQVAILFADIVNFTPRAASLPPEEVVGFLNRIFSRFDELSDKHGLEKIKTIGDAYMVAAGMPNPCGAPVHRIAEMALDMQRAARELSSEIPEGLQVRIGLHAGPAVAGVIGNKKLFYDVWGETVNTASRMESHGKPGRIQVTGPAYAELADDYAFEERGTVEIKGMGLVETWWLTGKATSE